jgi:hypothetical protein
MKEENEARQLREGNEKVKKENFIFDYVFLFFTIIIVIKIKNVSLNNINEMEKKL